MHGNNYNTEKIIEFLYSKGHTNFINHKELHYIKNKLPKNEYKIYETHQDCNKVLLYRTKEPIIVLLKISSRVKLRHQDVLGAIFSLGIKEDTFGDVIKYQEDYYVFVMPFLATYIKYNLIKIRNVSVKIEEASLDLKKCFMQEYLEHKIIVSSLRIDNVVSSLVNLSRSEVLIKFKYKEITLNYLEAIKPTKILRENDIFSVKKLGKFKYCGIINTTKKGRIIIKILQYN